MDSVEGTQEECRLVVAECLGRLALLHPDQVGGKGDGHCCTQDVCLSLPESHGQGQNHLAGRNCCQLPALLGQTVSPPLRATGTSVSRQQLYGRQSQKWP